MKTNELLRRYVDDRSEPAFEELVRQHIDLVYSAALRQVHGDVPAAQDVTQAVFSDLARKAPRLTQHTWLAGWLYTSTRYLAAKALRAEQCRRSHEQEAYEMNQLLQSTNPDTTWQELHPLLDDAMHDLSAADRDAVLMRYFERLPLAEIGARLGLKQKTAHMRIERAIDRLRTALAKRGVTSTVTALAALLTGRAVGGAPAGLAAQVSGAAFASVAATGGLTWGLLKLAGVVKGKLLVAAGVTALVAGLVVVPQLLTKNNGAASTSEVSGATGEPAAAPGAPSSPAVAGAVGPASAGKPTVSNDLVLQIVANDSGKPIAGATVEFMVGERNATTGLLIPTEITADKLGVCEIPIPRDTTDLLIVRSRTEGFVDTAASWSAKVGAKIPRQYTLRLDTAVPIGGLVVDEDGKPVAGAQVSVGSTGADDERNPAEIPQISHQTGVITVTDSAGRWRIARLSKKAVSRMSFRVTHPDYVADKAVIYMNIPEIEQQRLAGTYVYTLDRGITVSGIVVDPDGQPVPNVKLTIRSSLRSRETTNQTDGTFLLTGGKAGANQLQAEARGYALETTNMDIASNQTSLRLTLKPGNLVRMRVVDTNGLPVRKAIVSRSGIPFVIGAGGISIPGFGSTQAGLTSKQTDADGRVVWDTAPESGLTFDIQAPGYARAMSVHVNADGNEQVVSLHSARTISASVHDAATGEPIARFRVGIGNFAQNPTSGFTSGWEMSQACQAGRFGYNDNGVIPTLRFKFEAEGYASCVTRDVGPDEGKVQLDIGLFPAPSTSVLVLLPDGQPATNADIGLDMPGLRLTRMPGGLRRPRSDLAPVYELG